MLCKISPDYPNRFSNDKFKFNETLKNGPNMGAFVYSPGIKTCLITALFGHQLELNYGLA